MSLNESAIKKETQESSTIYQRDRKILQDDIQRIYNRIEYDRSLNEEGKLVLKLKLQEKEAEYKEFFGEEKS